MAADFKGQLRMQEVPKCVRIISVPKYFDGIKSDTTKEASNAGLTI